MVAVAAATTTFHSDPMRFLLAALIVASGCSKPSEPAPAPARSVAAASAGPIADTDAFRAELKAPGPFRKGEAATFTVRVQAKAPYHVNGEYPAKFRAGESATVKYAQAKLERNKNADAFGTEPCAGDGKDACVLNITVGFTPDTAGTVHLGGTVDIGVCNKDQCLIEKKPLDITVTVS